MYVCIKWEKNTVKITNYMYRIDHSNSKLDNKGIYEV